MDSRIFRMASCSLPLNSLVCRDQTRSRNHLDHPELRKNKTPALKDRLSPECQQSVSPVYKIGTEKFKEFARKEWKIPVWSSDHVDVFPTLITVEMMLFCILKKVFDGDGQIGKESVKVHEQNPFVRPRVQCVFDQGDFSPYAAVYLACFQRGQKVVSSSQSRLNKPIAYVKEGLLVHGGRQVAVWGRSLPMAPCIADFVP